ncbi:MAG: copper-binding protein [Candidatus Thiodiazotropha endolucinida]
MKKSLKWISILFASAVFAAPVLGDSHSGHSMHDHGEMASDANHGTGKGVLHTIDAENKVVNLTHGPIPKLNWMGMRMDLPVTKRVDLSGFKPNDKVSFTVKKGRDKQFRITAMELNEIKKEQ